ncbi:MAG: flagellar export protein FliJ [Azonexus sp.]
MSREQRIEILLHTAQEQGQEATRALAHRRQLLDEAGSRLEELLVYRDEYAGGAAARAAGLGVQMQDYWRFMSRLNSAIAEHRERMDQQKVALEQSFERWQETQRQVAVLGKVIERIRVADRLVLERGEQRMQDDQPRRGPRILLSEEA